MRGPVSHREYTSARTARYGITRPATVGIAFVQRTAHSTYRNKYMQRAGVPACQRAACRAISPTVTITPCRSVYIALIART